MKNNSNLTKYLFLIFIVINITSTINLDYDISSNITSSPLHPLSINSKDNICDTYIPSLFSPIPLVKNGFYENIIPLSYKITISNPIMKNNNYNIYKGNVIDNNIQTTLGVKDDLRDLNCYLGLSSGLEESIELRDKNNTLEYLKNTNQITEKKFSLDIWDLNSDQIINSKFYLGYSHKDFNSQNKKYIGTCQNIKEDTFWGCYFKQMIFNNTKIPLNNSNGEDYKIYFSSEDYTIKFPIEFEEIFKKASDGSCTYDKKHLKTICKDWFKEDLFIPLTLSNDNMDITLEIDSSKRFNSDDNEEKDSINIIFDGLIDYIIFPLKMFKNFHIQFDADNNIIRFYSTNKKILNVKIKEPEQENNSSPSALTVFLVILIVILLLGLGFSVFYFIKKRRSGKSEEINKFTKFEDEDDFKNMQEKKIY